ncbi:MAG: TetR/AcrR family transcriptional regulator [Rhodovibrionaceae bacterium]|nr:TetR/AcrR family transcriptional regulator [Rhodovibrionaceae bacterium]
MTLLSTRDESKRQAQLTRDDWIEAALEVLVGEGVGAVQITSLAKKLNVTRGSFYWHFTGREELLGSLLKEWHARNTGVMLSALAHAGSLEEGILDLFAVWVDHKRFDPALDQAVRDWARRSQGVRDVVAEEDESRVSAIAAFFERNGFAATEAFIRARVLYFTQVSYYALGVEEPMTERVSYLEAYFRCFTGREIDPAAADAFIARRTAEGGADISK